MHFYRFYFFCFLILTHNSIQAVSNPIDDAIKKNIESTTGVITFLTSQESFSAGIYEIYSSNSNTPSANFSTFKVPFRKKYKEHENGTQWSMLIGYGHFQMKQNSLNQEFSSSSTWLADSLSVGIGYSDDFHKNSFRWFSNLELSYTQIQHEYHITTLPSQRTENNKPTDKIRGLDFNWHTNTISIIPTIGLLIPIMQTSFDNWHYEPKLVIVGSTSIPNTDKVNQVTTTSGLIVNKINFGEVWQVKFDTWGMAINPQVNRTDSAGAVKEGLATDFWYEANLNFRLKSSDSNSWWHGLEYGFSYLQGNRFKGGQFSLSLSLDSLFKK